MANGGIYLWLSGILVLIVFSFYLFQDSRWEVTTYNLSEQHIQQLNDLYRSVPEKQEYVATINNNKIYYILKWQNGSLIDFDFPQADFSKITIHSHTRLCLLSELDKNAMEDIQCVQCGINKFKCWKKVRNEK